MTSTEKLVAALRAARLDALAERAETNRYHDFLSPLETPCIALVLDLRNVGTPEAETMAQRAINGDFDATSAEAAAWRASPDGQKTLRELTEGME